MALGGRGRTGWFLLAVAAGTVASLAIARRGDLGMRAAVIACAALIAFAVAMPPRSSRDLWAYAMYGRIVSAHHASPYTHLPLAYPHDAYLARMHPAFRNTRSVYGPAFTAVSAARAAGDRVQPSARLGCTRCLPPRSSTAATTTPWSAWACWVEPCCRPSIRCLRARHWVLRPT